jgi:hypothetical protein
MDGGRSRILWLYLSGGPLPIFFNVDGGRSQITISTRQGVHHRRFLALIVGAPKFSGYTS